MSHRARSLYDKLMDNTVLADLFAPTKKALDKVRYSAERFQSLPMDLFCLIGCLRHLRGVETMREQLQHLFHLEDLPTMPVARSTYSDALASETRQVIMAQTSRHLVDQAKAELPDRLAQFEELGDRAVYATDGSYQRESAHYGRQTPKQGGTDNPKGHMMLTFYDTRLGAPVDAQLETGNHHEMLVFKDYAKKDDSLLKERGSLWLADRAFVDMPFWDRQKARYRQTVITRLKDNLVIEARESNPFAQDKLNEGVISDETITLKASLEKWRLIQYKTPEGKDIAFLTNELELSPGLVAFLYLRRWDIEKCFDTWKNDFASGKAWSKSLAGITQQAHLAIMTSLLLLMFMHRHHQRWGIGDEKSLKKQEHRLDQHYLKTGSGYPWYAFFYRSVSKISRQAIRFLKECFLVTTHPPKRIFHPLNLRSIRT